MQLNSDKPRCSFSKAAIVAFLGLSLIGAASAAPIELPNGSKITKVDFERHVMGVFGKMGCNAGSCHGSFQGKGGFRMSLFGYDAEMDYKAITRGGQGRRVNRVDVDRSLMLLKPTGQMEHGGTRLFSKGSWQHQILRQWILNGMPRDAGSGDVKKITITPSEVVVRKAGEKAQIQVKAEFADGTIEDITSLSELRVNDDAIAQVGHLGEIETLQAGDTAVIVKYRGNVLPVNVMVPMTLAKGFKYPKTPEFSYVDREVFAKLRRLKMVPSDLSSDAEFLRRVTIDTIGRVPTADEVRKFLESKITNKREKKIDELLEHKMHAALWATKFCDITGNNSDLLENPRQIQPKLSQMWHDWFRHRIEKNVPYDQIVRDVLCATSRDEHSPEQFVKQMSEIYEAAEKGWDTKYHEKKSLDLFWRRRQRVPIEQWGEKTAVAFLGVRIECAQCHKHPFDRWTQQDYFSYANVFATLQFGTSTEARKAITDANKELSKGKRRNQAPQIREVYVDSSGRGRPVRVPDTNNAPKAKALGGPELEVKRGEDPRVALFEWMRREDNPFFARSFVNRVWGHYFGVGIVHPVDDFSLANPSSNDKLLDALAADFVKSGFDVRKLEKTILTSRTYQLSSSVNETNRLDTRNYAHSYVRPMMAEVVVDVINTALGSEDNFGRDAPPNSRAIEIGGTQVTSATLREAFRVFGRSPRTVACDCERSTEPTVSYKLYLMADPTLQQKLDPRRNRINKLVRDKELSDADVIEELFLWTVSRYPTDKEKKEMIAHLAKAKSREQGFADVLWALVNTNEFIFNH